MTKSITETNSNEREVFFGDEAYNLYRNLGAPMNFGLVQRVEVGYDHRFGFSVDSFSSNDRSWCMLGASFEHKGWAEIFFAAKTQHTQYILSNKTKKELLEKKQFAILIDNNEQTTIVELSDSLKEYDLYDTLYRNNKTATITQSVYEIYTGSRTEAIERSNAITANIGKELISYKPSFDKATSFKNSYILAIGQNAVDKFESLKKQSNVYEITSWMIEEHIEDDHSGYIIR